MGAVRPNTPARRTYPTFMLEIPTWAMPREDTARGYHPTSSHCWANRGPPEPGEWRPGGRIPGTPQILRKLLAPAIVQFDDHGKILRVLLDPFPKSRAHASAQTYRVRTLTHAGGAHKGRVWSVVAPVRTAQPRVISSAPAKTMLATVTARPSARRPKAAHETATRRTAHARHTHTEQPRRGRTASFAARGRRG
jgi:hypothetical protein